MVRRGLAVIALSALFVCGCLCVVLPFPEIQSVADDFYTILWESGEETSERYADACHQLFSAEEETLIFFDGNGYGEAKTGESYKTCYRALKNGSLAEMLSVRFTGNRLERAALYSVFGDVIFYSDGVFCWNGERLILSDRASAETVVLTDGRLSKNYLSDTNAKRLDVRALATVSPDDFTGSRIEEITAQAPYSFSGGALYYAAAGERRIVAALPAAELTVEDVTFVDYGALSSCKGLTELSLPFAGSTIYRNGAYFRSELSYLFGEAGVPPSLKRLTVRGGTLDADTFYGCASLEELDARGVEEIEAGALAPLRNLQKLILSFPTEADGFECATYEDGFVYTRTERRLPQ